MKDKTIVKTKAARPWGDYALRVFVCLLLLASGFVLLSTSTFTLRMREDIPAFMPGLTGPQGLSLIVAAVLSLLPLAFGRRFLGALVVSAFLLAGIGGYWWTTIPWDHFVTKSGFPATTAPRPMDYLLVASPAVIVAFYAVVSRASRLKADLRNRGADEDEVRRATGASFLAGVGVLAVSGALAAGMWALLMGGILQSAPAFLPRGMPAVILAGALLVLAYGLATKRFSFHWERPHVRRPSSDAAGPSGLARNRARRSPF